MPKSKNSRTNVNNFNDPVYRVCLEDGPTRNYQSSCVIKYILPQDMHVFYNLIPELSRYYKVTISIVENPRVLPF